MPKELTPTQKQLVVLLNNVNDLVALSNKRREAADVMRAIEIYADNKHLTLPKEKIQVFYSILLDSRPNTISNLIQDICRTAIQYNQ